MQLGFSTLSNISKIHQSHQKTYHHNPNFKNKFTHHSSKSNHLQQFIQHHIPYYKPNHTLNKNVQHSSPLVAEQLMGVSQL
ncbi:hypothetical protein, partial [Bacillus altitudinis]|uniref:hypothetical protein n=1 Tax=Bacillus altitudinis TaxID=293387 RepID=UPI001C92BC55